jgi:pimeloyl-ACP methyl ester carboxylesterase
MRKLGNVRLSDGRNLAYSQYGDPDGKPIFYCHGGVSSKSDVAFAQEFCEENGFLITAPDRPGIGDSDHKAGRSLLDWASDSKELLDQLGIEKTAVLGWSLGGPYALACAFALPERVSVVGTIGGAGQFDDPESVKQLGLLVDRLLLTVPGWLHGPFAMGLQAAALLPPEAMKQSLLSNLTSKSDREIVSALPVKDATGFLYESLKKGGMGVIEDYAAVGKSWGFSPSGIKLKTLIWHGEQDDMCPMSAARIMAESMPHAEFKLVANAGHFLLHRNIDKIFPLLCG